MATEVRIGRIRSVVLVIAFSVVTLNLYYLFWLHNAARDVRAFNGRAPHPGAMVALFALVPVVGWFASAWLVSKAVQDAQLDVGVNRPLSPAYPALWSGLAPVAGWYVTLGLVQGGLNRLWAHAVEALESTRDGATTLECPDCETQFEAVINPVVHHEVACPGCQRGALV